MELWAPSKNLELCGCKEDEPHFHDAGVGGESTGAQFHLAIAVGQALVL